MEETELEISLDLDVVTNIIIKQNLKVSPFPNPAYGFINIPLMPGSTNYLEVYSSDGKLIHAEVSEQTGVRLDLSKHPQGIYFIKLQSGNTMQSGKFLKL